MEKQAETYEERKARIDEELWQSYLAGNEKWFIDGMSKEELLDMRDVMLDYFDKNGAD